VRCLGCDFELLEEDRFCPACGQEVAQHTAREPEGDVDLHASSRTEVEQVHIASELTTEIATGSRIPGAVHPQFELLTQAQPDLVPANVVTTSHADLSVDELERRLNDALREFAAGNISASMLGRIETEISVRIEQAESARGPIYESPVDEKPSDTATPNACVPVPVVEPDLGEPLSSLSADREMAPPPVDLKAPAALHQAEIPSFGAWWTARAVVVSFDPASRTTVVRDQQSGKEQRTHGAGQLDSQGKFIVGGAIYQVSNSQLDAANWHVRAVADLLNGGTGSVPMPAPRRSSQMANTGPPAGARPTSPKTQRRSSGWSTVELLIVGLLLIVAGGLITAAAILRNSGDSDSPVEDRPVEVNPELADAEYRWASLSPEQRAFACLEFVQMGPGYFQLTETQKSFLRTQC
jgi:hypothetical protein